LKILAGVLELNGKFPLRQDQIDDLNSEIQMKIDFYLGIWFLPKTLLGSLF